MIKSFKDKYSQLYNMLTIESNIDLNKAIDILMNV